MTWVSFVWFPTQRNRFHLPYYVYCTSPWHAEHLLLSFVFPRLLYMGQSPSGEHVCFFTPLVPEADLWSKVCKGSGVHRQEKGILSRLVGEACCAMIR